MYTNCQNCEQLFQKCNCSFGEEVRSAIKAAEKRMVEATAKVSATGLAIALEAAQGWPDEERLQVMINASMRMMGKVAKAVDVVSARVADFINESASETDKNVRIKTACSMVAQMKATAARELENTKMGEAMIVCYYNCLK